MSVDQDARASRRAQRHVQHGTPLRDVDLVATEHGVAPLGHAALLGKLQQQPHGLVGDAVLRIVQVKPRGFDGQALAAPRIVGEEPPQVHVLDLLIMRGQCLPCRRVIRPLRICHSVLRDG